MKTIKVKSTNTGKEYELRIIKAGTSSARPIVHHEDIEKIVKEEKIQFTLAHCYPYSYPAMEIIASINENGCSAIGFGSCPPGSGGLGATDPVKAARCDARDNAALELLDFDWENAVSVDSEPVVTAPAEANNYTEEVVATAEVEEPSVITTENISASSAPVTSAPVTSSENSSATNATAGDNIGGIKLAFGKYRSLGKTIAELYATGGEETDWYNYICDARKDNGEYKYTGKYPDMMRQYRETQV